MKPAARYAAGIGMALGVASAVGIALADTASAAPERNDGRSSASRDSHQRASHRGPARDSGPARPAKGAAARGATPAPAAAKPPKSTKASSAGNAAASRSLAAGPERLTVPVDSAAQIPVPAPPTPEVRRQIRGAVVRSQPAPALAPGLFNGGRGRLLTIYQGTSFVIPNRWALWVTEESGEATFIADSAYDLKDEDQFDWNKLAGITFTPWRPERNASMVVWRYNLTSGMFEVGPFFDVEFAYVFPTDEEIITIPVDQTFSYTVDYDGISVSYGDRTVYKATPADLQPNFWTSARVTGWFGGSEVAPRTVSYYLRMG